MARTEKELPINNISYQFVGTEEDLIKFLKAITFEYLTANYPDTADNMHKKEHNFGQVLRLDISKYLW